jgi:hypothetical protein
MKMAVFWDVVWQKSTDISGVLAASISVIPLMTEAASTYEMVNFYQTTWCNIPEDSHLYTCCYENLESHKISGRMIL